jgi:FkbM family methyltransferase
MFHRLRFWKDKGLTPAVIYDIGANTGSWTREVKTVFPTARVEQFEANLDHRRPGVHMVVLGDTERETSFYKSRTDTENTGASIYREATTHFAEGAYTVESRQMIPLDTYLEREGLPPPDFLKLDVQGAELDILRGATTALRTVTCILLEVSLHRWNAGAPMIEDVVRWMDEAGFCMIDIIDTHFCANYLIQIDCLFARKTSGMRREDFVGY